MDTLKGLESRVQALGIAKLEKKIERLEGRKFFFFFRLRMLLRKIRFLRGVAVAALICVPAWAGDWEEIHGDGIYSVAQQEKAEAKASALAREFEDGNLYRLSQRTDQALSAIFRIAILNLKRHGFKAEAAQISRGWAKLSGNLVGVVANHNRNIGDFDPLSTFLKEAYDTLEAKLGKQLCYTLRLSDIKTLNFTIPVVFAPCKYGLNEFTLHFVHDSFYRGLFPTVSYWTTMISCSVITYGIGSFFVCSPAAYLVEMVVDKQIAPWLSGKIFHSLCE